MREPRGAGQTESNDATKPEFGSLRRGFFGTEKDFFAVCRTNYVSVQVAKDIFECLHDTVGPETRGSEHFIDPGPNPCPMV